MNRNTVFSFFLLILFSTACSKFNRVMKMQEFEPKYAAANEYYEKEDYFRAGQIYEDLVSISLGRPEAEELQFRYAYCYFHQKQYILSAHYFKQFYDTYGRSLKAEEALFKYAYSLFLDTPNFNLDQSHTADAIVALQDFLNKYSKSEFAPKATDGITELRRKLERKGYEIAKQYQKLRMYKSALIGYDNFLKDFPDSKYKEEVYLKRVETGLELAKISIASLQEERYRNAAELYEKFITRYPGSEMAKEAELYYERIQAGLKKVLDSQQGTDSIAKKK